MGLLSLEHSPLAYWADAAWYSMVVVGLAAALGAGMPVAPLWADWWPLLALVPLGVLLWTLAEYLLHRFVLHGPAPFCRWHAQHHRRPRALIGMPTLLSSTLIAGLVFAPAWVLMGLQWAQALTLGVALGYLAYGLAHHAAHHGGGGRWMQQCRIWHALHHHGSSPAAFGVTSPFWDQVFVTAPTRGPGRATRAASAAANAWAQPAAIDHQRKSA